MPEGINIKRHAKKELKVLPGCSTLGSENGMRN